MEIQPTHVNHAPQLTAVALAILAFTAQIQNKALQAAEPHSPEVEVRSGELDTDVWDSACLPEMGNELKTIPNESLWRLKHAAQTLEKYGFKTGKYFAVDVEHQIFAILEVYEKLEDPALIAAWPTSTAQNGLGTTPDSQKTPTGAFELKQVDGRGGDIGISRSPENYGERITNLEEGEGKALMTTRVIPMHGLEPENANSASRDIAIHGTNREAALGEAASDGCIRLDNKAVVVVSAMMRTAEGKNFLVVIDPNNPSYKVPPEHQKGTVTFNTEEFPEME